MLFHISGEKCLFFLWNPNLLNRIFLGLLNNVSDLVLKKETQMAKLFVWSLKVINVFITRRFSSGPGLVFMIQNSPGFDNFSFYISSNTRNFLKLLYKLVDQYNV